MSTVSAPLLRARRSRATTSVRPRSFYPNVLVPAEAKAPQDEPAPSAVPPLSAEQLALRAAIEARLDGLAADSAGATPAIVVDRLIAALAGMRAEIGEEAWRQVALTTIRTHAVGALVRECPLTRHAFARPRGYAGDAGLLDLIYGHPDADPDVARASDAGRSVFGVTRDVAPCASVRERRTILARAIDDAAWRRPGASVLAVACGHLREAEISDALRAGRIGRLVATDQDHDSLAVAAAHARRLPPAVETRRLSVRDFIAGRHGLTGFDLIYAAGLYDYLDDRIAARLTRRLFALLAPGGRLLVGNFLAGLKEDAYMDACMDWQLLLRSESQIRAFAGEISDNDIGALTYFADASGSVGYLELTRG